MTWVGIDDAILDNPKIADVGPIGFALHVAGITYAARNLTDGFIPFGRADTLLPTRWATADPSACDDEACELPDDECEHSKREIVWSLARVCGMLGQDGGEVIDATVQELVDAGLWRRVSGGYQIHDYLVYNPSREEVHRKRTERHGAAVARGKASADKRRAKYGTAVPPNARNAELATETASENATESGTERATESSTETGSQTPPNPIPIPTESPLSPNGDIPPLLAVVPPSNGTSNGNGTKHRPPGKGKPSPEVLARFTEAWNSACAPCPRLLKPPESPDGQRLVMQAWRAADGDVALLCKAIRLFALDPWNTSEHHYGYETFCRHADTWLGKAASPPVLVSSSWDA